MSAAGMLQEENMKRSIAFGLAYVASVVVCGNARAAGVEVCNQIIQANLFDEIAVFQLDTGAKITKKEFCEKVKKGSDAGINVVGYGDGSMSNEEARSTCSSDFSSQSYKSIVNTYSKHFSSGLQSAYETCVRSLTQNKSIEIVDDATVISWDPGQKLGTDGRQFPHYTLHLSFRWIPTHAITADTKSRAWVAMSAPTQFIDSHASWGEQSTNPRLPHNPNDPFFADTRATIKPNIVNTLHTEVITSVNDNFIVVNIEDAGGIKLVFPKKTQ
jgi:hypothetical protein